MQDLLLNLSGYAPLWLLSAVIVGGAIAVARLADQPRVIARRLCRLGAAPARIEVERGEGSLAVSIRPVDEQHVWVRIEGPAGTVVRRIDGEGLPAASLSGRPGMGTGA